MILVDANVLIYAYDTSSPRHGRARAWLEALLSSGRPVRFSWTVLLAFVRIGTNPRAFQRPLSPSRACEIVAAWLALPAVAVVEPTPRHWQLFGELVEVGQARGPLTMDAHLAALAIEYGATLATCDRDFARFPGVVVEDPLTS